MTSGKKVEAVPEERYLLVREEVKAWPCETRERLLRDLRGGEVVTLEEVAGMFGVCWRTVQRHIKDRKIKAKKAGRRWVIDQAELERLLRDGFPAGKDPVASHNGTKRNIAEQAPKRRTGRSGA